MKNRIFPSTFMASVAIATAFIGNSSAFAGTTSFVCGSSNGVPATMAQTPRGNVPVIKWVSNYFSDSGWTPQRRCQEVSRKFQAYYQNGTLNYLTTGEINGQPVVCVAQEKEGPCAGLLFTLKAESNPGETLQRLLDVRDRTAGGPLPESSPRVYININDVLAKPVEGAASSSSREQPLF